MNTNSKGKAIITGASSGIGAIAADRLAKRGHDLILVARNRERLDAVATRIEAQTGRSVDPRHLAEWAKTARGDKRKR